MRTTFISLLATAPLWTVLPLPAADLDFKEAFADPAQRTAALEKLVPGSRDWFFYGALNQQLSGDESAFKKTMAEWKAASDDPRQPVPSEGWEVLDNRRMLLGYASDPQASVQDLIRKLDLHFEDARPEAEAGANLPDRLDPALISKQAFRAQAQQKDPVTPWTRYGPELLREELAQVDSFDEAKAQWFYKHLTSARDPHIVPLLKKIYGVEENAPDFGESELEKDLSHAQLDELVKAIPALRASESFATTWMATLPTRDRADKLDPAGLTAHLAACAGFILAAPETLNSMKAHVLYHHLRMQREAGNFPQDVFLAYLKLPRTGDPLLLDAKDQENRIDTSENFAEATGCDAIDDESELVSALLEHFLAASPTSAAFKGLIEPAKLTALSAQAHLLAGDDPVKWSKGLKAEEMRDLQKETRVGFAPGRPVLLDSDSPVQLTLDLKNTPTLLVRIFEIDQPQLIDRDQPESLKVDMDIDGLMPQSEKSLAYGDPPLSLHRESIPMPELAGPGTWLVECVSGNATCRTLIRKGVLLPVVEPTAEGYAIKVFNEVGELQKDAVVLVGQKKHAAGADGVIRIPDHSPDGFARYVRAGKLAAMLDLQDQEIALEADPELSVTFHADSEQLIPGHPAKLMMKPRLFNHAKPLALEPLQQARVLLTAKLRGGGLADRVLLQDVKLEPSMEIPFVVPEGAVGIEVSLDAVYVSSPTEPPLPLHGGKTWNLQSDADELDPAKKPGSFVAAVRFSQDTQGYFLDLRGRNGEPCSSRVLVCTFNRPDAGPPVTVTLRTDARGHTLLGALEGITSVDVSGTDILANSFTIADAEENAFIPDSLSLSTRDEVRVPLPARRVELSNPKVTLVRTGRDGQIFSDETGRLKQEGRQVLLDHLPEGHWTLSLGRQNIKIRVVGETETAGFLVNRDGIREHFAPALPVISSAEVDGDSFLVKLDHPSPLTRVTLMSKRYLETWSCSAGLTENFSSHSLTSTPAATPCEYLLDRRLSDENRYILDRRNTARFPGLMLPRPGLLLNRWTREEAKQEAQVGAAGTHGRREVAGKSEDESVLGASAGGAAYMLSSASSRADFLARSSTILYELTPAADGTVRVPLKDLAGGQVIEAIAISSEGCDRLVTPLPPSDPELEDLRLTHPLDATKHYAGRRTSTLVPAGKEVAVEGVLEADWRSFSTLGEVFRLFDGAIPGAALSPFLPLTRWNKMDEPAKQAFLANHACNEVHLFLARKDRPFFDRYVKPRLQEKLEPTVIDDLLLGRDVSRYFEAAAWARLNAAEKALLARIDPQARARAARDMELRWEMEAPSPEMEEKIFAMTLMGDGSSEAGGSYAAQGKFWEPAAAMIARMRETIIPAMDFQSVTVDEVLRYLNEQSHGIPIHLGVEAGGGQSLLSGLKVNRLSFKGGSLVDALSSLSSSATLRWKVDEMGVAVVPLGESEVAAAPQEEDKDEAEGDLPALPNTVGDFISPIDGSPVEGVPTATVTSATNIVTSGLRSGSGAISRNNIDAVLNNPNRNVLTGWADSEPASGGLPGWDTGRNKTRVWKEQNYYRYSGIPGEFMVPLNGFWLDLAKWDGEGAFLSPHFNECTHNLNEALLCLAVLDLPFTAAQPETRTEDSTLRIKSAAPMLLYYRETHETGSPEADAPVLVRQTFYPLRDRFRQEGSRQVENTVTGDFVAGVPYGMALVVTNPSGSGRRLDLLAQIPAGAIPLSGLPETLSVTRDIAPYGVLNEALAFYFPLAGTFPVYPLHVADGEALLAVTAPRTLTVAARPAPQDALSWPALARDGTTDAVLERLRSENLHRLDLRSMLWRLHDRAFFTSVMEIFRDRLFSDAAVANYGFLHADPKAIRTALENGSLAESVGGWLDGPLLEVHRSEHPDARITDFDPLVNPRAHRFGSFPRLSHPEARKAYEALLDRLAWKPAPDDTDRLALCISLLTQDRVEEGLKCFDAIDPVKLATHLQYDYAHAMVHFYRNQPEQARAIATAHLEGPQELWAKRFKAVIAQADEIAKLAKEGGKSASPEDEDAEPSLKLALTADHKLEIDSARLKETELKFYQVDLEMLFSKNPFLSTDSGDLPQTVANEVQQVALDASSKTMVEIPVRFRDGNVLVSATSGNSKALRILDSPALTVTRQTSDRTLQVTDTATHKPLPETYVKVYALDEGGQAVFHKDGYTDLRGKFDYLTHTGMDVSNIHKIAILTLHPEKGARVEIIEL